VTHDISEAVLLADRVWLMTPRPGGVESDVVVDLPRPRGMETMDTPRFHELTIELWRALSSQSGSPTLRAHR
jgi:ABC-type nitrate/sulfonate/bicarbonate transport system ATPase subunit